MRENNKVSKNFSEVEFVPPEVHNNPLIRNKWYITEFNVVLAQFIRDRFGKPVYINTYGLANQNILVHIFMYSGFRPRTFTDCAAFSMHYLARANDIKILGLSAPELQADIKKNFALYHTETGLTTIEADTPTWTHCDNRQIVGTELNVVGG